MMSEGTFDPQADLKEWLELGCGKYKDIIQVDSHGSKGYTLPVMAALGKDKVVAHSDVEVAWFAYNFYFYFLGMELGREMPATLMYPISATFGHYPLSGNTSDSCPPVEFLPAYHRHTNLKKFGLDCGGSGFIAALVMRYLRELAQLDTERLMDICLYQTRHGKRDQADGNGIDFKKLFKALGLKTDGDPYDPAVVDLPTDILESVVVDAFEHLGAGESAVRLKLCPEVLLPPIPLPYGSIYVDLQETALRDHMPDKVQPRPTTGIRPKEKGVITYVPVSSLSVIDSSRFDAMSLGRMLPVPLHWVYSSTRRLTREFIFSTPNVLDAAMTAFFFVKVMAPVMQEMRLAATVGQVA